MTSSSRPPAPPAPPAPPVPPAPPPAGPGPDACAEIRANAAGLASLDERDPERRAAFAHAADCASCRAALAEGLQLMRLLDEVPTAADERPSPAVLARVASEILASLAADGAGGRRQSPREVGRRAPRVPLGPVAILSGLWLGSGILRLIATPARVVHGAGSVRAAMAMTALATSGAALALIVGAWVVSILPAASLLLSFGDGGSAAFQPDIGLHCAGLELLFALVPLIVAGVLVRRASLPRPAAVLAIAAGGGALVAQSVLHALCHAEPSTTHNLLFHTGPVLLAVLVGGALGARLSTRPG